MVAKGEKPTTSGTCKGRTSPATRCLYCKKRAAKPIACKKCENEMKKEIVEALNLDM